MGEGVADIGDLQLESGRVLAKVRIAYATRGTLSAARDNVILATHGYTSGPDMILPKGNAAEGSWEALIGPRKPVDTNRYFVICPNALGSSFGSTGAASTDPATGKPYGSAFPTITMRDVVASQHALLSGLGIDQLVAVIGPSFGGLQALQWGVSHPGVMKGIVAALASLGPPPTNVEGVRASLAKDPGWNGGDYYEAGNLTDTLTAIRVETLKSYGIDAVLARSIPVAAARADAIQQRARQWARRFDANALLVIMRTMASYDVTGDLGRIRARLLYVLSRTDRLFPPTLAPEAMRRLKAAGVDADYFEIDSDYGHSASSTDADRWGPVLRRFIDGLPA